MSRRWMVTWACWMAATILAWLAGSLSADEATFPASQPASSPPAAFLPPGDGSQAAASGSATASQPALAGPICVAILEPEVLADLPAEDRKALAAAIDALLTESLAGLKGFVLVDRQLLDKVLAEKRLKKLDVQTADAAIKPFVASGVLICSQIDARTGTIMVEAVSAQTGQLVAELYLSGKAASADDVAKAVEPKLQPFAERIVRVATQIHDKPLLEISGKLAGGLTRMAWMVDDFTDAAGAAVDSGGKAVWLVPRQPLVTKEERLLRVMGLGEAQKGDAAARLSPAPQMRLSFELADSAKTGVTFEKTPISLKLSLRRGQDKPIETQIDGEAGQWDACRNDAVAWLSRELAGSDNASTSRPDDSTQRAKQLAKEELEAARQLVADSGNRYDWFKYGTERAVLDRIARHALRSAHLDPTGEEAARYSALTCDALYPPARDGAVNPVSRDRVIAECQRYLDRFRRPPKPHNPTFQVMMKCGDAARAASYALRQSGPSRYTDKPNDVLYRYAKANVDNSLPLYCAWVEVQGTHNIWAVCNRLRHEVFSNCPEDELEREHDRWRKFWRTTVDKIKHANPPPPFQFVEIGYYVRKRDYASVRRLYGEMAAKFPKLDNRAWATRIPCTEALWKKQLTLTLRAAGDPAWKTWEPDFSGTKVENNIPYTEMTAFMNSLRPRFPAAGARGPAPKAPAVAFVVPEEVRKVGRKPGSSRPPEEALLLVDGEVWLSLPGPWAYARLSRDPSVLYRAKTVKPDGNKIRLSPEPLPWPARPDGSELEDGKCKIYCHLVEPAEGGSRVWIGTNRGLVRFDHAKDGSWKGRWYTTRDGFPRDIVVSIGRVRQGKDDVLLLTAPADKSMHVFTLNPRNGRSAILFDGSRQNVRLSYSFTVKLRDGRLALVELLGQGVYGDVAIQDIAEFSEKAAYGNLASVRDEVTGEVSIWEGLWDGPARTNFLRELSTSTIKPQRQAFRSKRITVFPFEAARYLFGEIVFLNDPSGVLTTTPYFYTTYIVGVGDTLWIAAGYGANPANALRIFGFRPGTGRKRTTTAAATQLKSTGDLWIGPFSTPDGTPITNLQSPGKGQLLVTTRQRTYLLRPSELEDAAAKAGRVADPESMVSAVGQRLAAAGWQAQVPAMVLRRRWAEALRLLDNREQEIKSGTADKEEAVRLRLWRAHVLARMPGRIGDGIEQYRAVAETTAHPRCARVFARMNQVYLLHKAGRYEEMLALVEQVVREFPQVDPGRAHSALDWYVQDARKHLAARSQPASGPATAPAANG